MATTKLSTEHLEMFFSGKYHHAGYEETVDMAERIRVHADGILPPELIEKRRPHESEMVLEYRIAIWKSITKPYFNKVLASLNKIRRSTEWGVLFDDNAFPARIPENERLDQYLTYNLPFVESLTNWAFNILLREWSIDANEWCVCMPVDNEIKANEYIRPYPYLFRSDQVIEPKTDDFLVVLSDEKAIYYVDGNPHYGDRYYIITTMEIHTWDQTSAERDFKIAHTYKHNTGILPAFRIKAAVRSSYEGNFVHESRLNAMMESFDECAREYSDLQAEVVKHIYSERWEIGTDDCSACAGKGHVILPGFRKEKVPCAVCGGHGHKKRGPYTDLIVPKPMAGENSMPMPPMGYLQKDVTIVNTQDARIDKHIWRGLSAVNMEHLFNRPLAESGVAKAYDADETNNFVHSCAEDIVATMDKVAYIINELRYSIVVPNPEQRAAMLPQIAVPERFDIFSAQVMEEQLANAKEKKVNPIIINAMEIDYANKRFSANPDVADRLMLTLKLDPLPNITEEDKVMRLQNNGITKETYIMSCNIQEFINRAIEEKGDAFMTMKTSDQRDIIKQYAQQQTVNAAVSTAIISEVTEP